MFMTSTQSFGIIHGISIFIATNYSFCFNRNKNKPTDMFDWLIVCQQVS